MSGGGLEVAISLDDERFYYPNPFSSGDIDNICDGNEVDGGVGDESFYCEVPMNSCLEMTSSFTRDYNAVDGVNSITVGFTEYDAVTNDFSFGVVGGNQWYSDTRRPYEVKIFRTFKSTTSVSSCYSLDASVGGNVGGADLSVGRGFERCSEFEEPAESYIWFLEVLPVKE